VGESELVVIFAGATRSAKGQAAAWAPVGWPEFNDSTENWLAARWRR